MTNRERYQKAFRHLEMKKALSMEAIENARPDQRKKRSLLQPALAGMLCVLAISSAGAYAADLGGIRSVVSGWFEGNHYEMSAVSTGEGYEFYDSETGEYLYGGGGIEYEAFGREKALDAAAVAKEMESGLFRKDDGSILFYQRDHQYDLTDLLKDSNTCSFKISDQGDTFYYDVTVEKDSQNLELTSSKKPQHAEKDYVELQPESD